MTMGTSWIAPRGASRVGAAEAPGFASTEGRSMLGAEVALARSPIGWER